MNQYGLLKIIEQALKACKEYEYFDVLSAAQSSELWTGLSPGQKKYVEKAIARRCKSSS